MNDYSITHRPCPFCDRPLTVDPALDTYVCLNKARPQWHTYVCVPVRLGKIFADHWAAFPKDWRTRNIWPAVR